MSKPFRFKQFSVQQDRCAMKLGTDSVLLGAWASLSHHPKSILDIGAGTGILSLMLAQRSSAEILDALEMEHRAFEQCVENFEESSWSDRLFCYHGSLEEFTNEIEGKYDLIVCNPPFYPEHYKTKSQERDRARFQDAMPFSSLIKCVSILLEKAGEFSIIIPFTEEKKFRDIAVAFGLYPKVICHVRGNIRSKVKRTMMNFAFDNVTPKLTELAIETSRHVFTKDYIDLTQDFYLNM